MKTNIQQLDEVEELLSLRNNLAAYFKRAWTIIEAGVPLVWNWHLDVLCDHLEAVNRGDIKRLLVAMPPRHGKSSLISVIYPSWVWITKPGEQFLTASYALALSLRDAQRCRELIDTQWYQENFGDSFTWTGDMNLKSFYSNDKRGRRIAVSVDGSVTGQGASTILCLDGKTRIQTNLGELPIQTIVDGKLPIEVVSCNLEDTVFKYKPVVSYMKHANTKRCVRVSVSSREHIDCTDNHKFWVYGKEYVSASELQIGDMVTSGYVTSVEEIKTIDTVFNIEVKDNHNYMANGVLLKNCDDLHNIQEGESDIVRQATLNWYDRVMTSRLNDQQTGKVVVVAQRIHEQDVIGHLLETGEWEYLALQAEYDSTKTFHTSIGWEDPRTKDGQPLWPEKFPKTVLSSLKRTLGIHYFSQYQQAPIRDAGNIFKAAYFFQYTDYESYYVLHTPTGDKQVAKNACRTVISTDLALSQSDESAYTVFLTWAVTPQMEFLLTDIMRERMEAPDSEELLWNKAVSSRRLWTVIIESVAYQRSVIQRLRRGTPIQPGSTSGLRKGLPITEYHPTSDKVARAQSMVVWFASGNFYFNQYLAGYADFKKELLGFPRAGKADQVDAVTIVNTLLEFSEPRLTNYDEVLQLTLEQEAIAEISKTNTELAEWLAEDDGVEFVGWWETI